MQFFGRFLRKMKFFLINRANRTRFSETRSLRDQNCMLNNFQFLKVTEKIYVNSRLVNAPRPKNFKFAPIQKRFRDSGYASLSD